MVLSCEKHDFFWLLEMVGTLKHNPKLELFTNRISLMIGEALNVGHLKCDDSRLLFIQPNQTLPNSWGLFIVGNQVAHEWVPFGN